MSSDVSVSPSVPASTKPPLKRALFNRPAWAKAPATPNSHNDGLLTRSNNSYSEILKEEARIRERKEAERQKRATRLTDAEERPGKRRRIREDGNGDDGRAVSNESDEEAGSTAWRDERTVKQHPSPVRASPRRHNSPTAKEFAKCQSTQQDSESKAQTTVIDLEDDDDGVDDSLPQKHLSPAPLMPDMVEGPATQIDYDDDVESDDEFAELTRQAREKQRQRVPSAPNYDPSPQSPPRQEDPVVQILIYSRYIPNTKPLIVRRRISQRLQEIREVWCQRQGFDADMTSNVFLTWRDRKLFDVTTCKSLGIGVNNEGQLVMRGGQDTFGEENRQIHMEAMTSEIYTEIRKAKANPTAAEDGEEAQEKGVAEERQQGQAQIRIWLKAKGFEDFKLKVKPTTTFGRIADAFRRQRNVALGRDIFLMFDGERLAPGEKVEDSEIGDLESIDVHVK